MPRGNTHNRYGQANPSNIGPNGRRVSSIPEAGKTRSETAHVDVVEAGSGSFITGISWDTSTKRLIVTRGGPTSGGASDTSRFGIVKHAISYISDSVSGIPEIPSWISYDSNGEIIRDTTILLPDDFSHEDGFTSGNPWIYNLPDGIGWCRLGEGSAPVGEARWDADRIDEFDTPPDSSKVPTLSRAYITDLGQADSSGAIVILVFNVPITAPPKSAITLKKRYRFHSNKSGTFNISSVTAGPIANSLTVNLREAVSLDERLMVKLERGAARTGYPTGDSTRPSAVIPVVPKLARSVYVPVINRFQGGSPLSANDKVILGQPILIRDLFGIEIPVYDAIPIGGGAGGSSYIIGTVVGGNAVDLTPNITDESQKVYSSDSKFSYSMPFRDGDGSIALSPSITSWTSVDIPNGYSIGDAIERTPPGICWVSLERPYYLGTSGWDASLDFSYATDEDYSNPPEPVTAKTVIGDFGSIKVYWSQAGILPEDAAATSYTISLSNEGAESVYVTSVELDTDNYASILSLSRALDPDVDVATVTCSIGSYQNLGLPGVPNLEGTISVRYSGDKFTLVPCLNRIANQNFVRGDLVMLDITPVSLTDEENVTKTVYDIFSPATSTVPNHHHLEGGGGFTGGSRAGISAFSDRT